MIRRIQRRATDIHPKVAAAAVAGAVVTLVTTVASLIGHPVHLSVAEVTPVIVAIPVVIAYVRTEIRSN